MCPRPRRGNTTAVATLTADFQKRTVNVIANVTTPKQPTITFSQTVHGYSTIALDDYTDDEIYACWYSPEEYDEIEKGLQDQLQQMEEGNPLEADSCSRGLKQYLAVNAIPKKHNVRKAIQVVLDLQDRQFELEKYDDQAISKAYQNVSSSCHIWAAVVGLRDRHEAAGAYDDDDDEVEDEHDYAGDFAPSSHTLKKSIDGTGGLVSLLKVAKTHGSGTALVSSQMLPLIMKCRVACHEGQRM